MEDSEPFKNVDRLPGAPWVLTGSFMMESMRTVEVNTAFELSRELHKLMELSPTGEVLVTKKGQ